MLAVIGVNARTPRGAARAMSSSLVSTCTSSAGARQLGVLDIVARGGDHAGRQHLVGRHVGRCPHRPFVLVTRVSALEADARLLARHDRCHLSDAADSPGRGGTGRGDGRRQNAHLRVLELHLLLADALELTLEVHAVVDEEYVEERQPCQAALLVRQALRDLWLDGAVKTSGAKGVHVFVPLAQPVATADVAAATRAIAPLDLDLPPLPFGLLLLLSMLVIMPANYTEPGIVDTTTTGPDDVARAVVEAYRGRGA